MAWVGKVGRLWATILPFAHPKAWEWQTQPVGIKGLMGTYVFIAAVGAAVGFDRWACWIKTFFQ